MFSVSRKLVVNFKCNFAHEFGKAQKFDPGFESTIFCLSRLIYLLIYLYIYFLFIGLTTKPLRLRAKIPLDIFRSLRKVCVYFVCCYVVLMSRVSLLSCSFCVLLCDVRITVAQSSYLTIVCVDRFTKLKRISNSPHSINTGVQWRRFIPH